MSPLILLFIFLEFARMDPIHAFSPNSYPSKGRPYSLVLEQQKDSQVNRDYNDDAFGLIFLSAFAVEHDNSFAGAFGVLSAVAAILVRNRVLEYRPLIPGLVAVATLLIQSVTFQAGLNPNQVTLFELGVCAVSLSWSIVQEIQLRTLKQE